MMQIYTYIFLICSLAVLFPISWLAWDVFKARKVDGKDASTLATTILYIASASFIFHSSQFVTVLLGLFGVSMESRSLIILLIDGSLLLLTAAFYYAYFTIRNMRTHL